MKHGKTLTFVELLGDVQSIEIPIIQRDYAQGRKQEKDASGQFLEAIKDKLITPMSNDEIPLDLDFIYGNIEGDDNEIFSVLDGQQRLTTLFLLHWYLAIKSGEYQDFINRFVRKTCLNSSSSKGTSRFSYKTRPSTAEFFDALVISEIEKDKIISASFLSEVIEDSQWFYLSWKQDPTVQSCLKMLDSIHEIFGKYDENLYVRLISTEQPYLTFQYLNLQSFGLSDELYIKMNARGKSLTDFENFKAWLFGRISTWPSAQEFESKVDQQWTDIFWKISSHGKNQFDEIYLRFFNLMAFYDACEKSEGSFDLLNLKNQNWIRITRILSGRISHKKFEDFDSFNLNNIIRIKVVLDYISGVPEDCFLELFKSVLGNKDYVTQIQFYAMLLFLSKHSSLDKWDELTKKKFKRWQRVTNNLIYNHRIDELARVLPVVRALNSLVSNSDELYEYLSGPDKKMSGFTKEQWEEECLKAQLIIQNEQWVALFEKYESHVYLKGKVGFLLTMSKTDDGYSMMTFEEYAEKSSRILSDKILRSENFVLQRALLSLDDYLVSESGNKYSFCQYYRSNYRERSENWLAVVTKPVFKTLLDKIDVNDISKSLAMLIENVDCGGWRELIVNYKEAIIYCKHRLIFRDGDQVFLLSKSTFRGYHVELRSFVLDIKLNQAALRLPECIEKFWCQSVYGGAFPSLHLVFDSGDELDLTYGEGEYFLFDGYEDDGTCYAVESDSELQGFVDTLNVKASVR